MRYLKISLVILALSWVVDNPVHALRDKDARESLKGLPGVAVVIETMTPEEEAAGLSTTQIQTVVELVLRSSGIKVLTKDEQIATPSWPYLYINVHPRKIGNMELYAFSIRVELLQNVSLAHLKKKEPISAVTWSISSVGSVGAAILSTTPSSVEELVKFFANDFLAMNPR